MNTETINKRLDILFSLKEELAKIKDVYQESLENDPQYQELQEETQKFRDQSKEKKNKVKMNSTLLAMEEQMKHLKEEIKENSDVLGQELADYYKESGSMEFTDAAGNVKRIVFNVKLVDQVD